MTMKSIVSLFLVLSLIAITTMQITATGSEADSEAKPTVKPKLLRHVVMFGFKETSSKEDVQGVVDAFAKLPSQIPAIVAYEHGVNNSPEGLNDGLTHCFLVSFADEAGREEYLPHPDHLAFVEVLKPHLEKVVVIDYWTK